MLDEAGYVNAGTSAELLGTTRADIPMVRWEYEVDVEAADTGAADVGFVPGRTCVPIRPEPDQWQQQHQRYAGLFPLDSFTDLTACELAVAMDATSEIALFGRHPAAPGETSLERALNQPDRPRLAMLLRPGDVFVDLAVMRDRFLGFTSYFTVKATQPIGTRLATLVEHFEAAYRRYTAHVNELDTFDDFCTAMDTLLTPPQQTELHSPAEPS